MHENVFVCAVIDVDLVLVERLREMSVLETTARLRLSAPRGW